MDGRGTPLDRRYSFTRQRERQLLLSALFSALCIANLVDNLLYGGVNTYDTMLFTVSIFGILAAILGSVGVLFHSKELISLYLVYIIGTLAFCVLYHVFQLGTRGAVHDFILLGLSILMVFLIWLQLFYALYFLRLLTLYDVYHSHPKSVTEAVPTEDLATLLSLLQQRPKWSQMVELFSMLGSGAETFTFDEFCQLESRLDSMERQVRREAQKKRRQQRQQQATLGAARGGNRRFSVEGFQPTSVGVSASGGGSAHEPLIQPTTPMLREDRLYRGPLFSSSASPLTVATPVVRSTTAASAATPRSSTCIGNCGASVSSNGCQTTKFDQMEGGGGDNVQSSRWRSGGCGGGVVTFSVTADDLQEAQRQLEGEEKARRQAYQAKALQEQQQPVMRMVLAADDLAEVSSLGGGAGCANLN